MAGKPHSLQGNSETLATIRQQLCDHIENQVKQFDGVDGRLDLIEGDVKTLVKEKGTKLEGILKTVLPMVLSLLMILGAWVVFISRMDAKVAELEGGRIENRANIALLTRQFQEQAVSDALRDERYKMILEKLQEIQSQLDKITRK